MFVIYGTPDCPWCDRAKELLLKETTSYLYIDVTSDEGSQEMFKERSFRTVPQVFDGDKHIGGFEELKAYLQK